MFNPRTDFTNLLHLDIHIKKLFDIQVCTFGIASYINGIIEGERHNWKPFCAAGS